jgi:diketogulonate reductase-like aldo/keto reductase
LGERDIKMIAYSPLARCGVEGRKTPSPLEIPLIETLALKYNVTPAQICIKWQIQRGVIAIPKSCSEERIISNINVFGFKMTDEEIASIETLDRGLSHYSFDLFGISKHKNWPFRIPF